MMTMRIGGWYEENVPRWLPLLQRHDISVCVIRCRDIHDGFHQLKRLALFYDAFVITPQVDWVVMRDEFPLPKEEDKFLCVSTGGIAYANFDMHQLVALHDATSKHYRDMPVVYMPAVAMPNPNGMKGVSELASLICGKHLSQSNESVDMEGTKLCLPYIEGLNYGQLATALSKNRPAMLDTRQYLTLLMKNISAADDKAEAIRHAAQQIDQYYENVREGHERASSGLFTDLSIGIGHVAVAAACMALRPFEAIGAAAYLGGILTKVGWDIKKYDRTINEIKRSPAYLLWQLDRAKSK